MSTRRRRIVIAALLTLASPALLAAVSAPSYARSLGHSARPAIGIDPGDPGLRLGWGLPSYSADFTLKGKLDARRWSVYNAPTKLPFPYSKANVSVNSFALHLAGQVNGPVGTDGTVHDEGAGVASTLNKTYGRWEARMRIPVAGGYSAVMTLWPHSNNWPTDGEIDVAEIHDPSRTQVFNGIHLGPTNRSVGNENVGSWTGWHVYGVDWEPKSVKFYIDGQLTYSVTDPTMIPSTPMHATLQLDQACNWWEGCRDASTPTVVNFDIDWMRYYAPARTS